MSFQLIICWFSYLKQTLEQFSVQPDGTSQHERLKVKRRYRIVCSADVALPLPLCSVFLYLFYNPDGKEMMRKTLRIQRCLHSLNAPFIPEVMDSFFFPSSVSILVALFYLFILHVFNDVQQ